MPLWGDVSTGGFAAVTFHKKKKLNTAEWVRHARMGRLTRAIQSLRTTRSKGPLTVLCDNEEFLKTAPTKQALSDANVRFWHSGANSVLD